MIRAAFALSLALVAVPAFATVPKDDCKEVDLSKLERDGFKLTQLAQGQYRYLQGAWAFLPPEAAPGMYPPGDGAAIMRKGSDDKTSIILFTKDKGSLICGIMEPHAGAALVPLLKKLKYAKDEVDL